MTLGRHARDGAKEAAWRDEGGRHRGCVGDVREVSRWPWVEDMEGQGMQREGADTTASVERGDDQMECDYGASSRCLYAAST
jgi:hypothetical protein